MLQSVGLKVIWVNLNLLLLESFIDFNLFLTVSFEETVYPKHKAKQLFFYLLNV